MIQVNAQTFENFLKNKNITKLQGEIFHSTYYLENENKVAYMETSSWGAEAVFMIEDDLAKNFETTNLITSILNK